MLPERVDCIAVVPLLEGASPQLRAYAASPHCKLRARLLPPAGEELFRAGPLVRSAHSTAYTPCFPVEAWVFLFP